MSLSSYALPLPYLMGHVTAAWTGDFFRSRLSVSVQAAHVLATRRWQLACALSLAHLAPLCSLFLPLAPPPGPTMGPSSPLSWRPGNRFHTSALCAAIADSISLPYRMTSQGGMGGQDLHSLANLLVRLSTDNISKALFGNWMMLLSAAGDVVLAVGGLQHGYVSIQWRRNIPGTSCSRPCSYLSAGWPSAFSSPNRQSIADRACCMADFILPSTGMMPYKMHHVTACAVSCQQQSVDITLPSPAVHIT